MNLIQQEKDLQSFSDQALLQEATQPRLGYAPYMVQTEIARRTQERDAYQKQMMAQQAQGAVPVAQQNVDRFVAQNMAAMQQPAAMAPGIASVAQPSMGASAVDQAFSEAQGIAPLMAQAPVQGMSEGGTVKRMQTGMGTTPSAETYRAAIANADPITRALFNARLFRKSEAGLRSEIAAIEAAGGDASALRSELASLKGIAAAPTVKPVEVIAAPQSVSAPGIASITPPGQVDMMGLNRAGPRVPGAESILRGIPVTPPPRRKPREDAKQDAAPAAAPAAPGAAPAQAPAADTYWADLIKQMEGFKPSKEKFERERQAMLLANLGALVGGATRRGDIATGIGQLVGQQIAAGKEFEKEEREALRDILAIRGQERAETREERRYQQGIEFKLQEIDLQRQQLAAETRYRMAAAANDAERNRIAQDAAKLDEQLLETRKRLAASQANLADAQAEYYRTGKGDNFSSMLRNQAASAADLESAL